jgi:uncharacterized protein DUF4304
LRRRLQIAAATSRFAEVESKLRGCDPEFTKVILDTMHGVLKPSGFRKKGSTFVKECGDDVVLEVNLQKSTSSTSTGLRATVNLRVYSRTLTRAMGYSLDYPADPHRHWEERIGKLMPEQSDRWWTLETSPTAVQAGKEMADALFRYGLPALDAVSSTEKLRALWLLRGGQPDYVAALADPQQWQAEQKRRLQAALERYDGQT